MPIPGGRDPSLGRGSSQGAAGSARLERLQVLTRFCDGGLHRSLADEATRVRAAPAGRRADRACAASRPASRTPTTSSPPSSRRRLGADAVRAPERRAAAVLPAPDAAPGAARHPGARAAGRRAAATSLHALAASRRPWSTGCGGSQRAGARRRRTARRWARCWPACTSPARDFARAQPNLRGLAWWNETVPRGAALSRRRASAHCSTASWPTRATSPRRPAYAGLPRGAVHADLFRDNVLFEAGDRGHGSRGFFDFYFAGVDTLAVRPRGVPERLVHRPATAARMMRDRADGLLAAYGARARR